MSAKTKYLIVSVMALVVIVGVMMTLNKTVNTPADLKSSGETTPPSEAVILPTGSPDDAVQAFIKDADDETAQIEADDDSSEIINSDVTNLNDFSHSADNY